MQHAFNAFTYWGLGLIAVAVLLRWRTARYDLKDKAISSAWQAVRGRRSGANPTDLEQELREITSPATLTGKATAVAGKVAGHFLSQAAAVVGLVALLLGAALMIYGLFFKAVPAMVGGSADAPAWRTERLVPHRPHPSS